MSNSEHSFALKELAPFPWKGRKTSSHPHFCRLVDAQDLTVLLVPGKEGTGTGDRAKEIAEYVLHAANSHEELLAAAREALRQSQDFGAVHPEAIEDLLKAVTKAGGKRE